MNRRVGIHFNTVPRLHSPQMLLPGGFRNCSSSLFALARIGRCARSAEGWSSGLCIWEVSTGFVSTGLTHHLKYLVFYALLPAMSKDIPNDWGVQRTNYWNALMSSPMQRQLLKNGSMSPHYGYITVGSQLRKITSHPTGRVFERLTWLGLSECFPAVPIFVLVRFL
jgi:hypothetical protein